MDFSKLKTKLVKHTLEFRFLAKTSRDELKTKDTWFLSLKDENGLTGIGECSIIPGLSLENPQNFEEKILDVSQNLSDYQDFHSRLKKFPAIRFGLETALQDLKTGGNRLLFDSDFTLNESPIPINGLVWMGSKEFMTNQVKEKIENGFSCVKLKIGAIDFNQELEILKMIRSEFSASDIELRVDANGAFSPENALEKLQKLSEFKIHSIEQPIKQGQTEEMFNLCRKTPIDIALDEELIGINEPNLKEKLLQDIQPQYIILKPSLIGGFKASEEWISKCKKQNINYWITSALEANIGLNAISQWTSTLHNPLPQGLGTGGLYSNNIDSPLKVSDGKIWYNKQKKWDLSLLHL